VLPPDPVEPPPHLMPERLFRLRRRSTARTVAEFDQQLAFD
jgi:hypothetical protein